MPQLEDGLDLIYQQDGAPPHFHNEVRYFFSWSPEGGVDLVSKRGYYLPYHITHSSDDMSLESDGGMIYWQGKTEELGEKPVPMPLCPPQIPHVLTGREPGPPTWEVGD
jgi:hypothetical protein